MWKIISLFYLESLTWQLQILPDTEQKCGKKLNPLQKKKKSIQSQSARQTEWVTSMWQLQYISSLSFSGCVFPIFQQETPSQ